jgi:fibronectin-binding autotransporter adhesin
MNHVFRVVWSASTCTFIAVSEYAKSSGKGRHAGRRNNKKHALMLLFTSGLLLSPLTSAAPRYWDVNGTGVSLGGTGTWDTSSAFWSGNNDGVSGPYLPWSNVAFDDSFFAGTAGVVTLGVPINVQNLTFQTTGYTLNGSTLSLGGVTPTITTNPGVTATINSVIAGTVGLIKAGTGNLALNGVNTFSGGINVGAGGLSVNGDAALGAAGNGITMANGTSLGSTGALAASREVTLTSGQIGLNGSGVGSAHFTGAGGLTVSAGVSLTNDSNNYTGQTRFGSQDGSYSFTSIADLGMASSLGAPTTVANGTVFFGSGGGVTATLSYIGDGDSSNRNWQLQPSGPSAPVQLRNGGTGTLTLTGSIALTGGSMNPASFNAATADLVLLGVITSTNNRPVNYAGGGSARTITLGGTNTYAGNSAIGNVTVKAGVLTNTGVASSFGTGTAGGIAISGNGVLSYTGAGASSNRLWTIDNGTINNDGSGALTLSGPLGLTNTGTLGGSYTGSDNLLSGVISGTGSLAKSGAATWVINGANTYTGTTTVNGGTLRAGSATALGATSGAVGGGTLDLNDFNFTLRSLAGTGGIVDMGTGTLTLDAQAATNTSYAGNIIGSGGLTKNGASTQTLTGTNTYTGATTVNGGTLRLNFGAAGAPISNIISSASTLNMGGGTLSATGAAGVANTQTFNGLNVTGGNSNINATSGAGGSTTVNFGAITHTGGLINFSLPVSGNFTTSNTTLGGWATINGTDNAKVVGGNITAFTLADYTHKDNAANWLANEFITDTVGFFGTVGNSVQLAGLRYSRPVTTTVTIAPGKTLGVDGTIIVAPSVGAFNQTINGGSITGTSGGGVLGIQQNSTGNFTIGSQIIDNGGSIGFTKAGTGLVTLTNTNNTYTGATIVSQGILSVNSIANGGAASSIGASSTASSNLLLEGSTLRYIGGTTSSDRGFTLAKSGAILGSAIDVTAAATNLSFSGLVTSTDGANFTKSGAGTLTLTSGGNDYTGSTTVNGGTLAVNTLANGGLVSGIGASSNASGNLVLNGGALGYTGGTTSTNRGFTVGLPGAGGSSGGIDVSNAATTLTVSGTAVGDDGLRKEGAGTLVLSGTNTYTGGTAVNAGTLRAGSTQAFGNAANNLSVASGATADLNGFNTSIGALVGGGSVTLGSATLTSTGNSGTFSGSISGSGGFTRGGGFGATAQTMSGCNNTYTGVTSLNGGQINVDCLANGGLASGIGASSSASSSLVFNSGILRYTGGSVNIDRGFTSQSGMAAIDVANAATTLGFSGAVVGGALVRKDGVGTLVLSGNNTYTGGTQVTAGIMRAGSATAFGTGQLNMANAAGATLDANGFNQTFSWLQGGGTTGGNINLGAQTLTLSSGNSAAGIAYAGNITGTGNLVKNGAQIQRLSGCNSSYTGSTTINSGFLSVDCLTNGGSSSAIGASSSVASNLVIGGGLVYTGAATSSDRLFTLGTAGGSIDASGTGALNLTNTGAIALLGTNAARTFTLTGTNTGNNTLSAQLDNNGTGVTSLTKTGTGTWILTNNNSYTGVTTISGGVLEVSQLANGGTASGIGAASSAASNLVIGNGSTLRYTGAGDSTDRLFTLASGVSFIESSGTGAINFTNTGTIELSNPNVDRTIALGGTNTGNNTLAGVIGNSGTGITTLAKNDSGTWVLTGNNTYTGNTVINNGNLMIGNGGTSGNLGAGNVIVDSATSTLSMNRSDAVIFNAIMSGPGTFAQVGTGTTTLTANNNIGATKVSAGTLDVNGVLNTGTMAMSGTSTLNVDGTVQAAGGTATLISGDAAASTVNVNAGATLRANGDLGDGSDALNLTGTLDTGSAALSLGAGNDTLTLNDGALITGVGIDGGSSTGADTLVVNNALALTLDAAHLSDFEFLSKQNVGTLTTTGNQVFSAGTAVTNGTLDVNGSLLTPSITLSNGTTLNVDGTVEAAGSTLTLLTGSGGVNTVNVNAGAVLRANGDLGAGSDVLSVSGTLDTGSSRLNLGDGDDLLTLNDGAVLLGQGVDAGNATTNDRLVLNNALGLTFDAAKTVGFESLRKQNSGTATMTGNQSFSAGTTLAAGALVVSGNLTTPTVTLGDNTVLTVDGTLQAVGATTSTITGSAGANSVIINGSVLASGDLGDGNDVLDVAGVHDTGGGVFALGDGDDTLTIHDGTTILGTISAGAGTDTFNTNLALSADLGAVQGFETLSKTGVGTLNITGPMSSDFTTVNVLQGTVDVTAGGSVAAALGNSLTTLVATGARLNVDGNYGCGAGDDAMTVAGTVSGSGVIDLCAGNDTLTLNDGAVLTNTISGGAGAVDVLRLNNANALSFNLGNITNFELLQKDNLGEATLLGNQNFSAGTLLNGGTLVVMGLIDTPTVVMADDTTLKVGGTLGAAGGTALQLTGSGGVNSVIVDVGGTLRATGDLGGGGDLLDVAGTLDAGAGGTLSLGDGDDTFIVHDGTTVIGSVAGGAGIDTRVYDLAGTSNVGALIEFEGLIKRGIGRLNLTGPANSELANVVVEAGTLDVQAGTNVVAQAGRALNTQVMSGATLNIDGNWTGSDQSDSFDIAGRVSGSGTLSLAGGNDTLTLRDGADLSALTNAIDGGAGTDLLVADIAGSATLGGAINFESLTKSNIGTLNVNGPALSDFTTVLVEGGTLNVSTLGSLSGVVSTTVDTGARLNVDGSYRGSAGDDTMDVSGAITGNGAIELGNGDDVLTLNDGADLSGFTGILDGGNHSAGDRIVLNNALALSFGGNVINFETLVKTNTGLATLTGNQSYSASTELEAGSLLVAGNLETPTVNMKDDTTLTVAGTLQATSGSQALITGSAGQNTVIVAAGGVLTATGDLGDGNDTLDVAGTLDAGAGGSFNLGAGDDTFIVHDGTIVTGMVVGGAGSDTRVYDLAGITNVGALTEFEGLTKRGLGTLNLTGPDNSELVTVKVEAGTLNVQAGSHVVAQTGSALNADIDSGATLNVDGRWTGSAQSDHMDVSGTLSGSGTIDLADGDDILTLHDGADLSGLSNPLDGGAHTPVGDTVVLDVDTGFTLDGSKIVNFENLKKQNIGTATLVGPQTWSNIDLAQGALNVGAGGTPATLVADTLTMADGTTFLVTGGSTAGGNSGPAIAITGSAGANTVGVAEGGTLNASGDLGDGNDTLDVAGTLNISGVFDLGAGDDTFKVYDSTTVTGVLDGGAGNDTLNTNVSNGRTATLGSLLGFESLEKSGAGTLRITDDSTFVDTTISAGTLAVSGNVSSQRATVAAGATLDLQGGHFDGTSGVDTFNVSGRVIGTGTINLAEGNDTLTLHDSADLSAFVGTLDGGAGTDTLGADISTAATLGPTVNFETLNKGGAGTLTLGGTGNSDFSTINVNAGTLAVAAGTSVVAPAGGTLNTQVARGATLAVDGHFGCGASNDSLTVSGHVTGSGTIDLCAGDDTLTLNDGADLQGFTGNLLGGTNSAVGDTLVLNNATDFTFSAANVTGFEVLRKINTGTATLTGNQTYSLRTAVEAGQLEVAGQLTSPSVAIGAGARLAGSGRIVGNVLNEGTIAPGGHGIGTLTVDGDVTFGNNSVFNAEIDPSGASDHLNVSGTVSIAGGTVDIAAAGGTYAPGNRWTLISAGRGVNGTFSNTQFSLPFLNLTLGYDPNSVYLQASRNDTPFTDLATTGNERSAAEALASLDQSSALALATLNLKDAETVRNTYNWLSGEIHSSLFGVLLDDSRFIRQATLNRTCNAQSEQRDSLPTDKRLSTCPVMPHDSSGSFTLWGQAFGSFATIDGNDNAAQVKREVSGLYLGGDTQVADNWRVGLVTGYENRSVDVNKRKSSAGVDSYHLGVYSNGVFGPIGVHLGAVHTLHKVDTKRVVELGKVIQTPKSSYDVQTDQVFGELSYRLHSMGLELEPFVGITYVYQGGDAFQERGGYAALKGESANKGLTYTTAGLRGAAVIAEVRHAVVSVTGSVALQRLLDGDTPERSFQFDGSSNFKIEGAPLGRNSVPVEAGIAVDFASNARVSLGYRGQFSSGYEDHGMTATLSVPF